MKKAIDIVNGDQVVIGGKSFIVKDKRIEKWGVLGSFVILKLSEYEFDGITVSIDELLETA